PAFLVDRFIAFTYTVEQSKFQRIYGQFFAELVHQRFQGKKRLGSIRRAICSYRNLIGHYLVIAQVNVRTVIGAGDVEGPKTGRGSSIGTTIKDASPLDSDQRAIPFRPQL